MRIGVPNQARDGESRVALTPEVAGRLKARELEVLVESGAGERSHITDAAFEEAGARIGSSGEALGAEIVTVVKAPSAEEIGRLPRGAVVIGFLDPLTDADWQIVRDMVKTHIAFTKSAYAAKILDTLTAQPFVKVMPRDYKRVLLAQAKAAAVGRAASFQELVGVAAIG